MSQDRDGLGRRAFLGAVAAAGLPSMARGAGRQFYTALVPGSIGVKADQAESIRLAVEHGFDSVQPLPGELAADGAGRHVAALREGRLRWAAAGLPVEFRRDEESFAESLAALPQAAEALQSAGVTRVGTWLRPSSETLTYLQNFRQTARRLRQVAKVLQDHGLRLGLEYVGTKRNWTAARHSAVHTLAGTVDLISEIGRPNVGVVLDSWHWWTSKETGDDIRALSGENVIAADLNDAPAGIEMEEQYDNQRELPLATGVIDAGEFLGALVAIGFDGPVRAEPFSRKLNEMEDGLACSLAVKSLNEAFAIVDQRASTAARPIA